MELVTLPYGTLLSQRRVPLRTPTFTSYDRSPVTGLDYAVSRYYDSQQGRFTQADPLGLAAMQLGQSGSNNAYAYCEGDPINRLDSTGLRWIEGVWIGDTAMIGEEIVVIGHLDPPRAGDSPDENTREALARESKERGEPSSVNIITMASAPISYRLILHFLRWLTVAPIQPYVPPPPSQVIDIQQFGAERMRRPGGGGGGSMLIIFINPLIYPDFAKDRLVRPHEII
jgi:RHS repeat-associated protein